VLARQGNGRGPAIEAAEFEVADSTALIWLLGISETLSGVRSTEIILVKVLKRESRKYDHVVVGPGQFRGHFREPDRDAFHSFC
jgi:hypothetical protein